VRASLAAAWTWPWTRAPGLRGTSGHLLQQHNGLEHVHIARPSETTATVRITRAVGGSADQVHLRRVPVVLPMELLPSSSDTTRQE
jgi:hypothetical protein